FRLSTAHSVHAGDILSRGCDDEAYRHCLVAAVRANRHMADVLALFQTSRIDCDAQAAGVARDLLRRDAQACGIGFNLTTQRALAAISDLQRKCRRAASRDIPGVEP